jgi:hypothetical protein
VVVRTGDCSHFRIERLVCVSGVVLPETLKEREMPKPKQDDPAQSKRFIEMAQEQASKFDEKDLARAVKKLAPHAPIKKPKKK